MALMICAPQALIDGLEGFLKSENIGLQVTIKQPADLEVVAADGRRESDTKRLFCEGWIQCAVARTLAEKLRLPLRDVGKLLDFLNVKIRNCELGCFQ